MDLSPKIEISKLLLLIYKLNTPNLLVQRSSIRLGINCILFSSASVRMRFLMMPRNLFL